MFRQLLCTALLIPPMVALTPLSAQIYENEPAADLVTKLALKLDKADPSAPLAPATQSGVAQSSFAFALFANFASPLAETVVAGQSDPSQGWRLLVRPDGALCFEARTKAKAEPYKVSTLPGVIAPGSQHHIVLNILRDASKPNAGIVVDGVELASGVVPPAELSTTEPLRTVAATAVRLYHRSLTRPEVLALQLEAVGQPSATPASLADVPFQPRAGETIALVGGTEAVALAESGVLEATLLTAYPQARIHFRTLAWEGDTVFRQDRPLNFGELRQQLARINAGTVLVMFGRQESLTGAAGFQESLNRVLDEISKQTPNIILVGPAPLEGKAAPLPNLQPVNERLHVEYNAGIKEAAKKRGIRFVDVIGLWPAASGKSTKAWTTDGVTLTDVGVSLLTQAIGAGLELSSGVPADSPLISALQNKNTLWHSYWRPTNWAFLHGDRTQQPSSRDSENPQLRFFPSEQEKYLPLLREAEEKAFKLADELAARKLP